MMDDLISRAAAIEAIKPIRYCGDFISILIHLRGVDAAPVVHGYWIEKQWTTEYDWGVTNHRSIVCSHCNTEINKGKKTSYCPNCGAKMEAKNA